MNFQAIRILFLKDLFLSRKFLFAYFVAGMVSAGLTTFEDKTISFVGFILTMTVAIAAGIHFIGMLLLSESSDQTRLFVMSLPVSLLDYSIGKIAVVLTTYLIPWTAMLASTAILAFIIPGAKHGAIAVLPAIFLFLLSAFMIQLITAVISESVGWTISVMVGCNVALNVFLMKLFAIPDVLEVTKSSALSWPPVILQIIGIELLTIVVSLVVVFVFQTRKRDLI